MKKNLSKKISLLLCSTFLLTNIMGSSFVYAVRTRSQTKTDARSNTTIGTGAKKRTHTGDSESNKRTRLNPSEPAAGERPTECAQKNVAGKKTTGKNAPEAAAGERPTECAQKNVAGKETTGKNTPEAAAGERPTECAQKNVAGKETTGKNAPEAAAGEKPTDKGVQKNVAGKETTGKNAPEAAAGEKPTGMSTSEANARSEHSRIPPESRYNPGEGHWYVIDEVLCVADRRYRIFLRIVDLYRQLCVKYEFRIRINLANPREDGNMPDMVELVLNSINSINCHCKKENKAFKELADYIRANMRLILDPTQCSAEYFYVLYYGFEKWARDFCIRNRLRYERVMPIINYY